jgi:hypothetical protein
MRYTAIIAAAIAAHVSAHGVVTEIQGANGVTMPGLSGMAHRTICTKAIANCYQVIDGTPRDCATPACGSEADTSIIRKNELGGGRASALGRTQGGGPVDAASAISTFMGGASSSSTKGSKANKRSPAGEKTSKGSTEQGVAKAAGTGATSGMPTCADDGTITMTFHQVNQDGAGPLTAAIDPTSGGTDPSAFKTAQVTQNVPGIGIGGLSGATTTDFPLKVQMPQGMTCSGSAGGASNVCIVRVQNSALAGPFGGSAAFVQSAASKKRAIEYNLRRRHIARGILGKADLE